MSPVNTLKQCIMYKTQIFNLIVNKTAAECEVTPEEIRGTSHRSDIVDARCIAYQIAIKVEEFTPRDIAIALGKGDNLKAIRELLASFEDRWNRSKLFRNIYNKVSKELNEELL